MFGVGILSMIVLVHICIYAYGTLDSHHSGIATTTATTRIRTQPNSIGKELPDENNHSWMDRIIARRTMLADASHQLKATARDRKHTNSNKSKRGDDEPSFGSTSDDLMVDVSILHEAVVEAVRDVGVRGLLFDVLSDDFEYYVYSDESNDAEEYDDDYGELDAYWEKCYSNHGVGVRCNEWDVWWIYHYIGITLTDMLLEEHELLWDGSSGDTIANEEKDDAMAELLDRVHSLQATLPYVTQSSFHAQHALIWRYVEKSPEHLVDSYPWELALKFCRGDGSRPKEIVGRPVNKGIDHECFHGFGHAMFYAVASKQLRKQQQETKNSIMNKQEDSQSKDEAYLVIRPHSSFELSPESYCEIHDLCRGASPPSKKRKIMDPNDEASSNSYKICLEGVVHSVRLLSDDSQHMTKKETAIRTVKKQMERCERRI